MEILKTVLVTFFAGLGAGLGTGFAGMSAAAVITPMLVTFLGIDPYMAVGIALASDVLASAVSAYTYGKNKNLDIRNGLIMMGTVLVFTVVGSFVSKLVPSTAMGNFSVFMTFLLGVKFIVKPVMTTKETMQAASAKKRDDAADTHQRPRLRAEDRRRHERVYHDLYRTYRSRLSFCHRGRAELDGSYSVRRLYPALGAHCRAVRQQSRTQDP